MALVAGSSEAPAATFSPAKPVLAGDPSGNALAAAWTEEGDRTLPAPTYGGTPARVVVTVRVAGQDWSQPVPVSDPHAQSRDPRIVVDDAGDTLVTWQVYDLRPDDRIDDNDLTTVARWRLANGTLTAPQELTGRSGSNQLQALLATAAGTVLAVTQDARGGVQVASATPGAAFGAPRAITGLGPYVNAAITPDGTLLLAGHGPETGARVEFMRPDGTITRAVDLTTPGITPTYSPPVITAAPDSGAVVTWLPNSGPSNGHVGLARFAPDGSLVNSVILPQSAEGAGFPVGQNLDPSGIYTLLMNAAPGPELRAETIRPGALPVDGASLSAPEGIVIADPIATDFDGQGGGLAAWQAPDGQINAAARAPGGDFARLPTVTGPSPGGPFIRAVTVLQRPAAQIVAWDEPGTTAPPGASTIQALISTGGVLQRRTLAAATEGPTTWVDGIPHGPHVPQVVTATASLHAKRLTLTLRCSRTLLSCDAVAQPSIGQSHLARQTVRVPAHQTRTFHFALGRTARSRARRTKVVSIVFLTKPRDGYTIQNTLRSPVKIRR